MHTRIGKWHDSIGTSTKDFQVKLTVYGDLHCFGLIEEPVENTTPRNLTNIDIMRAQSH